MQTTLSPRASADIQDILQYTLEQWGEEQQIKYSVLLNQALERLQDNPHLGHSRENLFTGCRIYRVEQHIIFYSVHRDTVMVARVLHGRMDARRHLLG